MFLWLFACLVKNRDTVHVDGQFEEENLRQFLQTAAEATQVREGLLMTGFSSPIFAKLMGI